MSQIFSIWLIPFHVAPVTLTTVLDLTTDSDVDHREDSQVNGEKTLYYITKQEDLYQVSEFVKFVIPHFGHFLVVVFNLFATLFCVLGTLVFYPITWLEEKRYIPDKVLKGGNLAYDMELKVPEIRGSWICLY